MKVMVTGGTGFVGSHTVAAVSATTGRKLGTYSLSGWPLLWQMRALDSLQRLLPFRLPFNFQGVYSANLGHRCDDSATRNDFGIEPRPLAETMADTIRWMAQQGYIDARLVGSLSLE